MKPASLRNMLALFTAVLPKIEAWQLKNRLANARPKLKR